MRVESLTEVPGGWESDVYDVHVRRPDQPDNDVQRLALRRYVGNGEIARREYTGMQLLFSIGYPVPSGIDVVEARRQFES